jgi:hypothetical protein
MKEEKQTGNMRNQVRAAISHLSSSLCIEKEARKEKTSQKKKPEMNSHWKGVKSERRHAEHV